MTANIATNPSTGTPVEAGSATSDRTLWILRAEGTVAGGFATLLFVISDANWLLYVALLFAPDLAIVGYLHGLRVGALLYNLAHSYVLPLGLAAVGILGALPLATFIALIWIAHIGFDRMLGYGLKHPTGFKHTHLGDL